MNVGPEDAPNLQAILDRWKGSDTLKRQITVCFAPGKYELVRPLRLTAEHSNFTLEACHDGAILEANPDGANHFLDGLIVLTHANNVTVRGLRFHLPLAAFRAAGGKFTHLETHRDGKRTDGPAAAIAGFDWPAPAALRESDRAELPVSVCAGNRKREFSGCFRGGNFRGQRIVGFESDRLPVRA